jgi:hypothetical protein
MRQENPVQIVLRAAIVLASTEPSGIGSIRIRRSRRKPGDQPMRERVACRRPDVDRGIARAHGVEKGLGVAPDTAIR